MMSGMTVEPSTLLAIWRRHSTKVLAPNSTARTPTPTFSATPVEISLLLGRVCVESVFQASRDVRVPMVVTMYGDQLLLGIYAGIQRRAAQSSDNAHGYHSASAYSSRDHGVSCRQVKPILRQNGQATVSDGGRPSAHEPFTLF